MTTTKMRKKSSGASGWGRGQSFDRGLWLGLDVEQESSREQGRADDQPEVPIWLSDLDGSQYDVLQLRKQYR